MLGSETDEPESTAAVGTTVLDDDLLVNVSQLVTAEKKIKRRRIRRRTDGFFDGPEVFKAFTESLIRGVPCQAA